jgi:hypothetical protein
MTSQLEEFEKSCDLKLKASLTTVVVVSLRHEAVHHWPECPIEDVKFLRDKHRHEFHIVASKAVTHTDRDVEIIMLKRRIKAYIEDSFGKDFGRMSCEDIATDLLMHFDLVSCSVLEDGENGANVWRNLKP